MSMILTTHAQDKGTFAITCAFTNESGEAVAPDTMTWTLTDLEGTVINDREDVEVSTPSASETVVLSGDDLKASDAGERIFTVEATYTSVLGSGLPLKSSVIFYVDDLKAVT